MGTRTSLWTLAAAVVVPALLFPAQGCEPNLPEDWAASGTAATRPPPARTTTSSR